MIHCGLVLTPYSDGCFACSKRSMGNLYFDEDEESDPKNHACVVGVCSEGCAIRIIQAAEEHYAEGLGAIRDAVA